MSSKQTRPGGQTPDDSKRSFGGPANSNTTRQADAQPTARVVNVPKVSTSAPADAQVNGGSKVTARNGLPGALDYGGDGVPLKGTFANPSHSPNLGKR